MALSFPSSPTLNQLYPETVSPGEPQWQWNSTGWRKVINNGQAVAFIVTISSLVETTVSGLPFIPINISTFTYI